MQTFTNITPILNNVITETGIQMKEILSSSGIQSCKISVSINGNFCFIINI